MGRVPEAERLEERQLLTAVDLFTTPGNVNNPAAGPGPFGVESVGNQSSGGAGWSVAVVGDVNGDGFQDYLIGAPTIANNNTGSSPFPVPGNGLANTYLIFGSASVTSTTISNFLALPPAQRGMALSQLGNPNQTNPLTNGPGFNFNGITFSTPTFTGSQLGMSVAAAGDVNGDGLADFLIGAPGISNPNNPLFSSAGAAYLVYGSPTLFNRTNKTIALDTPSTYADQKIITFTTGQAGALTGRSVAGIGGFLNDTGPDIAIGAPGASFNGVQGGAVFVVPHSFLSPARTLTVDLLNVGQNGSGIGGVIFAGSNPTGGAGFSVAGAGNVDGNSPPTSELLIGAPDSINGFNSNIVGPGRAYLVYGSSALPGKATVGSDGHAVIQLSRVGNGSGSTDVLGAVFAGGSSDSPNSPDLTGYSVSTAGDFNGDGLIDFMIGSPGYNSNAGRMDIFYGTRANPNPPGPIAGSFVISNLVKAGASLFELTGSGAGQYVGYSVGSAGLVNTDGLNDVLVGAPGFGSGAGEAVLIPGNAALFGSVGLASVENAPVSATVFRSTFPTGTAYVGASVGGNSIFVPPSARTVDADGRADFLIGAPGSTFNSSAFNAGAAYLLEGAFVPLANPVTPTITSPIGVGGFIPPYTINATTPADLTIYILSSGSNTPNFNPVTDISPSTIAVNGKALPDPSTFGSAGDLDGDGIPDAKFTFSPRSLLNLPNGTVTFTVSARTTTTGNLPNELYSGSVNVTVTGGGPPGPVVPGSVPPAFGGQFTNLNAAAPQFGESLIPTPQALNQSVSRPLPPRLAFRQFIPHGAFGYRMRNWAHPGLLSTKPIGKTIGGVPESAFTHRRFPNGVHFGAIHHHGPTIGGPTSDLHSLRALFPLQKRWLRLRGFRGR